MQPWAASGVPPIKGRRVRRRRRLRPPRSPPRLREAPSFSTRTRPSCSAMRLLWVTTTRVAAGAVHLEEKLRDLVTRRGIEIARRLVGQHEGRIQHQGPGDGDPLAPPPESFPTACSIRWPRPTSPSTVSARPCISSGARPDQTGHHHVLDRTELRQQMVELEDEAEEAPRSAERFPRSIEDVLAPELDEPELGRSRVPRCEGKSTCRRRSVRRWRCDRLRGSRDRDR